MMLVAWNAWFYTYWRLYGVQGVMVRMDWVWKPYVATGKMN